MNFSEIRCYTKIGKIYFTLMLEIQNFIQVRSSVQIMFVAMVF